MLKPDTRPSLQPLLWLMGLLLFGLLAAIRYGAPPWVLIVLVSFAGAVLTVALVAYVR